MKKFAWSLIALWVSICFSSCGGSDSVTTPPVTPPAVPDANGQWAWISGAGYTTLSSGLGQPGVYGTLGSASAGNVPGRRGASSAWAGGDGSLWVFGGFGLDSTGQRPGELNDLWKFDPATKNWTWMSGSSSASAKGVYGTQGTGGSTNAPGARQVAGNWIDGSGDLWIFGGGGIDSAGNSGALNDLWSFSPSSSTWTWVSGSKTVLAPSVYGTMGAGAAGNTPGARQDSASWIDSSGKFWLLGGYANGQDDWNDLWMFDSGSKLWTWVGGSADRGGGGVYGTMGVTAAGNHPGAREKAITFTDASGNLWLFGGYGYDAAGVRNYLNDLWEFNLSTLEWTWVSGSDKSQAPGTYGTHGFASAENTPGARGHAASWVDSSGNLWMFGGEGYDSAGNMGDLNDFWMYTIASKQWIWVGGSNQANALGTYGTQGATAATNIPGSRSYPTGVRTADGNLWLFGGYAPGTTGIDDVSLNDLWRFHP